jgi:hypothetical protein
MTRKDYVALAEVLKQTPGYCAQNFSHSLRTVQVVSIIADRLADYCAADNPAFDRARFLKACGVQS